MRRSQGMPLIAALLVVLCSACPALGYKEEEYKDPCAHVTCPASTNPCSRNKCVVYDGVAKCVSRPRKDGSSCNADNHKGYYYDNNKCIINKCYAGKCIGKHKKCPGTNSPCTKNSCNPYTGACKAKYLTGKPCDDGVKCTSYDTCDSYGVCKGKPTVCAPSAYPQCSVTKCNELTGKCTEEYKKDGTVCDDGNKCTIHDACYHGVCKGVAKPCTNSTCVAKTCNPHTGACDATYLNGNKCDDGKACTTHDVCYHGACKGTPVVCPASDKPCTKLKCSEYTGQCSKKKPLADGTPCQLSAAGKYYSGKCAYGVCKPKCPDDTPCAYYKYNHATGTCVSKLRPAGYACDGGECDAYGVCKGKHY